MSLSHTEVREDLRALAEERLPVGQPMPFLARPEGAESWGAFDEGDEFSGLGAWAEQASAGAEGAVEAFHELKGSTSAVGGQWHQ